MTFVQSVLATAGLFALSGFAAAEDTGSAKASQWDVTELRIPVTRRVDAPFAHQLSAEFTHASGTSLTVPGFYDGHGEYVIRFTAPLTGNWSYQLHSDNSELANQSGTLAASAARKTRHGGILINKQNPRRFVYADGQSYFPIAFECDWLFALDADNPDDIPDTRRFIDTLADSGFNQVVMNVYAHDVKWKKDDRLDPKYDYGNPDVFPFGGTNENPDFSQLNVEYFQRLDRVIEYLDRKGMAAHLMIYVWNKQVTGRKLALKLTIGISTTSLNVTRPTPILSGISPRKHSATATMTSITSPIASNGCENWMHTSVWLLCMITDTAAASQKMLTSCLCSCGCQNSIP